MDFRLIVTSATLDAEKFSKYFFDCPILYIPGRTFPVDILYAKLPEPDYLEAALLTVLQIHMSEPPGDILVFLTGQEEIDTAASMLEERLARLANENGSGSALSSGYGGIISNTRSLSSSSVPPLFVLPVYAALPSDQQSLIFQKTPPGTRKCILATNIAETSLTIDGIYYVVDPGFVKQKVYNPRLGMDSLLIVPISQAQAKQRAGRAGRTGPGTCFRLYTEEAYLREMQPATTPDIQRTNLATTVLTLKALGIKEVERFDWMDAPPSGTLFSALQYLFTMEALNDRGELTDLGRKMADFPLEPPLSKCLLSSMDFDCLQEMLSLVAMLSIPSPFIQQSKFKGGEKKGDREDYTTNMRKRIEKSDSDHLTLLNVFELWQHEYQGGNGQPQSNNRRRHNAHFHTRAASEWANKHGVQHRLLLRALDIRSQLNQMVNSSTRSLIAKKLPATSNLQGLDFARLSLPTKICMALTAGFFMHIAKRDPHAEGYLTLVDNTNVHIHPSSVLSKHNQLSGSSPDWILYHELVLTSREFMRNVSKIDPKWLPILAPKFFQLNTTNVIGKGTKLQPLFNRFEKEGDWRLAKRCRPTTGRPSQAF